MLPWMRRVAGTMVVLTGTFCRRGGERKGWLGLGRAAKRAPSRPQPTHPRAVHPAQPPLLPQVRPAADGDEWLGQAAPRVPELDAGSDSEGEGGFALLAAGDAHAASDAALKGGARRTSFRCLHDALEAAKDGDVVELLPGTHNGLG